VDAYYDAPQIGPALSLYGERYFQRAEREVWATMAEAAATERGPHPVYAVLRVTPAGYFRLDVDSRAQLVTLLLDAQGSRAGDGG
jgi:hypothetical protein